MMESKNVEENGGSDVLVFGNKQKLVNQMKQKDCGEMANSSRANEGNNFSLDDHPSKALRNHGKSKYRFVCNGLSATVSFPEQCLKEEIKTEKEADSMKPLRRSSAREAKMKWKYLEDDDNVGIVNPLKRQKDSLKIFLPTKADVPVWARKLESVSIIEGNLLHGITNSKESLNETIELHSRSILCDYIKSHPGNFEKRRYKRSQTFRILWHLKRVPFDGIPFFVAASNDLRCIFGMKYKEKRKVKKENDHDDPSEGKLKTESAPPKKKYKSVSCTSCPAKIAVKIIVKFPSYAVHPGSANLLERKAMLQTLRNDLSEGRNPDKEELCYVTLPLESAHNHPFTPRSRSIHPAVIAKVKEFASTGMTSPKTIKKYLDIHIQSVYGQDVVPPHPEDRAFFPKLKDIGNLVYNHFKKTGIGKKSSSPDTSAVAPIKRKSTKISAPLECVNGKGHIENVADHIPLQASTLQEAVQTFCTDEPERGATCFSGRPCETEINVYPSSANENMIPNSSNENVIPSSANENVIPRSSNETANLAELVRGQLESLRNITFSLNDQGSLQDLHQSLQTLLNQYSSLKPQLLQSYLGNNITPTAFILQESGIDHLSTGEESMQVATGETLQNSIAVPLSMVASPKFPQLRQLKSPVALQCLTTNVVPTITMSQLSSSQNHEQVPTQVVTPLSSHTTAIPPTISIPQPTYQTVAPMAHDPSGVPVQLSLPPYVYYLQEVAVPETSTANVPNIR